jgi:hypothetical protein
MNVVALLLAWLPPLLPAATVDRSAFLPLLPSAGTATDVFSQFTSAVVRLPIETWIPWGPSGAGLSAPVWDDEEDAFDNPLVESGLLCRPYGRDFDCDDVARLIWPKCNLARSPSQRQPLRC